MEKRNSFSSSLGFVLAAAGSAVGLGNIWRFPYLAAKDGGGLFLLIYLVIALTFGYTMMITEVAIGRKTKQGALTAYSRLHKKTKWIGIIACAVPFIILPYYCTIGGWIIKYCLVFLTGQERAAAEDDYFTNFISGQYEPVIYNIIFLALVAFVIYRGVNKGIEKLSKFIMPVLLVLIIVIAVYSLTIESHENRTALEGFKVYVVPSFAGVGAKEVFVTLLDAMGQLFYSISVAMGIMITYGSYFRDDGDLVKSVNQIELFDMIVAFLAGVMIIPAVYVFLGEEGMTSSGPGLMFIALPKVFSQMGAMGNVVGALFFLMVLFAALTSAMSILEAIVAGLIDGFGWSRKKAVTVETVVALVIGVVICFGYNIFYFKMPLPNNPKGGQILDILDYASNQILMPVVAISTCILVGWILKPDLVIDEATKNGEKFGRKKMYVIMIKFIAPVMLLLLFLGAVGIIKI